jgi:ATP synthase protein I
LSKVGLFNVVRRVIELQSLTVLVVYALTWVLVGSQQSVSALLGGLVGLLPNMLFAVLFGRKEPGKTATQVVRAFYFGEALKLLLTALLFVIVFHLPGISALPLFIAFVAVTVVFWFSLLLSNYQSS